MKLEEIFSNNDWHCFLIGNMATNDSEVELLSRRCSKDRISRHLHVVPALGILKKFLSDQQPREALVLLDTAMPGFSAWGATPIISAWPDDLVSRIRLFVVVPPKDWDNRLKAWSDPVVAGYFEKPFAAKEFDDVILKPSFLRNCADYLPN